MDFYGLQLEIMLALLGVAGLLLGAFVSQARPRFVGGVLTAAVAGIFLYSLTLVPVAVPLFGGLCRLDPFALLFKRVLLGALFVAMLLALESRSLHEARVEFLSLMLMAAAGMLLLASVNELICLFVALELVALCFYVLNSFLNRDEVVLEAGVKYLVMGAISASLTAYGISYLYGATGQTQFEPLREAMLAGGGTAPAYRFGLVLVLLGIGFKLAMVPLQMWAPDVYQGAPTPASAFLASCSKVAGFVLLLRLFTAGLVPAGQDWTILLAGLAGVTLLYGTLGALAQTNLKRLLGYSSIAHAGYLLMGLVVDGMAGRMALEYYLVQYAFTVLCAFLVISTLGDKTDRSALTGLFRRSPLLALSLFVAMMSLAGVPPFSGALGKFFVLLALITQGGGICILLAGLGAAAAVIALFFYVGVLKAAFVESDEGAAVIPVSWPLRLGIAVCLAVIIVLGVWPQPLVTFLGGLLP